MKATDDLNCTTCRYYYSHPPGKRIVHGECMRFPPTVVRDAEGRLTSAYPLVNDLFYCGEYEAEDTVVELSREPYDSVWDHPEPISQAAMSEREKKSVQEFIRRFIGEDQ
jgi:hypothetical protein